MQRLLFLILSVFILLAGFQYAKAHTNWFDAPTAFAVGELTVNWGIAGSAPIFTISNGAPGQVEKSTVSIKNAGTIERQIGIRGFKSNENKNLSEVLNIVISSGGVDIYGGTQGKKTLRDFLTEYDNLNGFSLGNLSPSSTKTFDITLIFDMASGNEYQNATVTFDLFVGIQTNIPAACEGMSLEPKTIFGTESADKIQGTSKNDLIITFNGNDVIDSGGGNDCIVTLDGNKTIDGGSGQDNIKSQNGNSKINGGSGNDTINFGTGNSTVVGGSGDDTITGGGGNNVLGGGSGNDKLNNGNSTSGKADGGSGVDACTAKTKTTCEK